MKGGGGRAGQGQGLLMGEAARCDLEGLKISPTWEGLFINHYLMMG